MNKSFKYEHTIGKESTFPQDMPKDHAEIPVWNSENWFYEDVIIDHKIRSLRRTISEGERTRVDKRVSKVDLSLEGSDLNLILNQVEYVYDMVVTGAQKDLDTAIASFENNFGETISNKSTSGPKDQAEVDEFNKMYGTEFTMETFPKD